MNDVLSADGRTVIVAVDHPLYSWPCKGLEDRAGVIRAVSKAGADSVIASYGTIRDHGEAFGEATPILKLDLTTVSVGGEYPLTEYVAAWTVDDAQRIGAGAVLTFVQLGAEFELSALRTAGRVAAAADLAGLPYVCEIMPVKSDRFPDPYTPIAIAACVRTGAELGAHVVKTSMPTPPEGVRETSGFGTPVVLAGGELAVEPEALFAAVRTSMESGAAGMAFGRNVWGSTDPSGVVRRLVSMVHGEGSR